MEGPSQPDQNLLLKIGFTGLFRLVWRSMPGGLGIAAFPYGIVVYGRLLRASTSLAELRELHERKFAGSLAFRMFRPRYTEASRVLEKEYRIV